MPFYYPFSKNESVSVLFPLHHLLLPCVLCYIRYAMLYTRCTNISLAQFFTIGLMFAGKKCTEFLRPKNPTLNWVNEKWGKLRNISMMNWLVIALLLTDVLVASHQAPCTQLICSWSVFFGWYSTRKSIHWYEPKHIRRLCYSRSDREQPTTIKAHTIRLRIAVKIEKKIRGTHAYAMWMRRGILFPLSCKKILESEVYYLVDMNRFRKL